MAQELATRPNMLALVSEQAIPNVMGALLIKPRPRNLICILPEDTKHPGRIDTDFETVFNGIDQALGKVAPGIAVFNWVSDQNGQPVSPYNSEQVKRACSAIREDPEFAERSWVYNVTGGTKVMAQAALDDARCNGCRAMYVDTDSRRVIWDGQGPVSFDEERLGGVGVSEYLTAYGVSVTRYADSLEPDLRQAAYAIGRSHAGPNLMKQIKGDRMPCQDHHEAVYLPSQTLAESGRDLLFKVCELLSDRKSVDLEERPDGVELTARTGDEPLRKFFWGGRWLEYYVFETICRLAGEELGISYNPPWRNVLFRWAGIKYSGLPEIKGLQGPANELDVAVTRGARLLVCECKTGKHVLSPDHLYKLQVIGHKLGTFADKVLVTDAEDLLDRSNRSTRQGVVRALTLNTVVIEASQLPGLADILKDPEKESRRQKRCFGLAA